MNVNIKSTGLTFAQALDRGFVCVRKVFINQEAKTNKVSVVFQQLKKNREGTNELLAARLNGKAGTTVTATVSYPENHPIAQALIKSEYFVGRDAALVPDNLPAITAQEAHGKLNTEVINIQVIESFEKGQREKLQPVSRPGVNGAPATPMLIEGRPFYRLTDIVLGAAQDDWSLSTEYQKRAAMAPAGAAHIAG